LAVGDDAVEDAVTGKRQWLLCGGQARGDCEIVNRENGSTRN